MLDDQLKTKGNLHIEEKLQFSIEKQENAKTRSFELLAKDKEVGGIEIVIHEGGANCQLLYTIKLR